MSDNDSDADMVVVPLRVSNSMKENGTFLHVQVRVQIAVFSVAVVDYYSFVLGPHI